MENEKEEKRILSVNLNDFSFSKKNTQKKREPRVKSGKIKMKSSITPAKKNDTLRKQSILKLIRQQQQQRYDKMFDNKTTKETPDIRVPPPSTKTNTTEFANDFESAKDYMVKLTEQQKTKQSTMSHNTTLKHQPTIQTRNLMNENNINAVLNQPDNTIIPVYGCLKNGNLPTFRTSTASNRPPIQIGDTTQLSSNIIAKQSVHTTTPPIIQSHTIPSPPLNAVNSSFKQSLNRSVDLKLNSAHLQKSKPKKRYQKKTLKRRYNLGKCSTKPVVSVLLSNKTIRNHTTTKTQLLKQTPINDVKRYLIKHGFIRVGSTTPNDVLRKMYETSQLICGEVHNHNEDNLLFNFLHNSEE